MMRGNTAEEFFATQEALPEELPRVDFDALCTIGEFSLGPFRETFGNGYGDPYSPKRRAFGVLKDGRLVFTVLVPRRDRPCQAVPFQQMPESQDPG